MHSLAHADYPNILECGRICAGHMEQDLAGAREREAEFKADARRRSRWLSRQWRISGSGNDFLNADGFHIVVYRRGKIWAARRRPDIAVLETTLSDPRGGEDRSFRR